jgi:hypothetical protein
MNGLARREALKSRRSVTKAFFRILLIRQRAKVTVREQVWSIFTINGNPSTVVLCGGGLPRVFSSAGNRSRRTLRLLFVSDYTNSENALKPTLG